MHYIYIYIRFRYFKQCSPFRCCLFRTWTYKTWSWLNHHKINAEMPWFMALYRFSILGNTIKAKYLSVLCPKIYVLYASDIKRYFIHLFQKHIHYSYLSDRSQDLLIEFRWMRRQNTVARSIKLDHDVLSDDRITVCVRNEHDKAISIDCIHVKFEWDVAKRSICIQMSCFFSYLKTIPWFCD